MGNMTVICVDDDKKIFEMTVNVCGVLPCSILAEGFMDLAYALVWLKNNKADIAIIDINMPDIGGIMLTGCLTEYDHDVSIFFLTGYDKYALDAYGIQHRAISTNRLRQSASNLR